MKFAKIKNKLKLLKVRWSVSDCYYFSMGTLPLEYFAMVTFVVVVVYLFTSHST